MNNVIISPELWQTFPEVKKTELFSENGSSAELTYTEVIKDADNVSVQTAEGLCSGVHFQIKREWFCRADLANLLVYREIFSPDEDCIFQLSSDMESPDANCAWEKTGFHEFENNVCGMYLKHRETGKTGFLCETTQIMAATMRVDEQRTECTHSYRITAFVENPIKLEKYISFHLQEEGEMYAETAMKECRQAAIIRFDSLQKEQAQAYRRDMH